MKTLLVCITLLTGCGAPSYFTIDRGHAPDSVRVELAWHTDYYEVISLRATWRYDDAHGRARTATSQAGPVLQCSQEFAQEPVRQYCRAELVRRAQAVPR